MKSSGLFEDGCIVGVRSRSEKSNRHESVVDSLRSRPAFSRIPADADHRAVRKPSSTSAESASSRLARAKRRRKRTDEFVMRAIGRTEESEMR